MSFNKMVFDLIFISQIFSQESFNDFIEIDNRRFPYDDYWIKDKLKEIVSDIVYKSIIHKDEKYLIYPEFYIDYMDSDNLLEFAKGNFVVHGSITIVDEEGQGNFILTSEFSDKEIINIMAEKVSFKKEVKLRLY